MKPLYTEEEYKNCKRFDKLPFECYYCSSTFYVKKHYIDNNKYCNLQCVGKAGRKKFTTECSQCHKSIIRTASQLNQSKSDNHFCCKSCAATYNNTHKKYGVRRSKLESLIEQNLKDSYQDLDIIFNGKEAINSELDVYIPSLKLAFELNGIFHYEPIYGKEKLESIQNNDNRKFQACLERGIELCIIDTSSVKHVKNGCEKKYLDIIYNIINQKLNRRV